MYGSYYISVSLYFQQIRLRQLFRFDNISNSILNKSNCLNKYHKLVVKLANYTIKRIKYIKQVRIT